MLHPLWKDFEYQPHQIEGIEWAIEKEKAFPHGGVICDEMGLGKTIQILSLVKHAEKPMTLIMAPLCTLNQWHSTAEQAGIQVWRSHHKESTWVRPENYKADAPQIYVINYERAIFRPSLVLHHHWSRAVYDEAHRMREPESHSYELAAKIKADNNWFLTATPIVNGLDDARSLFTLLGHEDVPKKLQDMEKIIQGSVLCRKMEDLRESIPALPKEAREKTHILDFNSVEEEDFYRGVQGIIQRQWKALENESGSMTEIFRLIMLLRQLSIHPQVYIEARRREWYAYNRPDWIGESTKFKKLKNLIYQASGQSHRWIIFCHFHREMELLKEYLEKIKTVRRCQIYNGTLNLTEKTAVIEKSKEPLPRTKQEILLVQLQSGGIGLNLQHCDRIVFMGPWWTAAIMDQAIGRAVRIGQSKQVLVHHLVLKEEQSMNIDKRMIAAAERKRELCDRFLKIATKQVKP